jgi:hypothetical protein
MRILLTVLGLVLVLGACSSGGDGGPSAAATEKAADDAARDAVGLAVDAVGGSDPIASAAWRRCLGGVGHQYDGGGQFAGGQGDPKSQLEDIRSALTGAGFEDVTKVDDKVAVERDGVTVVFSPPIDERTWRFSYLSACDSYPDDEDRVQQGDSKELDLSS